MQSKKKQTRSRWLRKLMHMHMLLTGLSLSAYFAVAFADPGFLSYDLRQKYHALADDILVTARVLAPPVQPVVTGTSSCNSSTGVLSVDLNWADDINSYTYNIDRDSLPLVSGLTPSGYSDTGVVLSTTYEYVVTAIGPMGPGFAVSDPVSITTLSVCDITAVAPAVSITSFAGRGVDSYGGMPRVFDRRPSFSGTTNIPNAIIQVVVGPPSSFMAEFTANVNGYFLWQPPFNLSYGTQTFTVTAIDPNDALRQASATLQFSIKKRDEGGGGNTIETTSPTAIVTPSGEVAPVDFSLAVTNRDKKVFQGEALNVYLFVKNIASKYQDVEIPVRYSIVDAKGNSIIKLTTKELLQRGDGIQKAFDTPMYVASGKYFVQAEVLIDETNVSRSDTFTILEVPFINVGGGAFITYAEIVHNLGWVVLTLLILLLLWLFMFIREYGLYLHAIRHITEQSLKRAGFLTKGKGVIR